jgi:hypothetical protein
MKTQPVLQSRQSGRDFQSPDEASVSTLLHSFFEAIARDPRISCGHIGIYSALLQCWATRQYRQPLMVFSHQVIGLAKVSSRDTYFRYVRQLSEYGYIRYEPSFSRKQPSVIHLGGAGQAPDAHQRKW